MIVKRINFNLLSASDVNLRHDDIVTSAGCIASLQEKIIKLLKMFLKEEKICYKMMYYTCV